MDIKVSEKLDNFFSQHKFHKYKKREILISPDKAPAGIFYLKEGVVKQYAISANGEELTLNIYKPVSIFPMSYAVNNTIPIHYFEAMDLCLVGRAPKKDVLKFIKKEPDVLLDLVSRIYNGLEGFFLRMEYLMAGNAQTRLITELLIQAKRFGEKQKQGTLIKLKLTEKDLASQSGIARETVSREIQKLKEKGLVSFQKRVLVIHNLRKFEEVLLG